MNKTIAEVAPVRPWTHDQHGTMYSVDVKFTDNEGAAVSFKTMERAVEQRAVLAKLIGTPHEYGLEPRNIYQGFQQYKLTDYPGKPQQGSGGGGSGFDPRREAGMRAGNALNNAVALCVARETLDTEQVLFLAEDLYRWTEAKVRMAQGEQPKTSERPEDAWEAYRAAFAALYEAMKLTRPDVSAAETQRIVIAPLCEANGWDYPLKQTSPVSVLRQATDLVAKRTQQALASVAAGEEDTPL